MKKLFRSQIMISWVWWEFENDLYRWDGWTGHKHKVVSLLVAGAQAEINHLSSMLLTFGALGGVWSEAAAGTSPTETLGGWGFLYPSKQLCLPRGQNQQYPIHYKEYRRKEGKNNKSKRNNKHLFAVLVIIIPVIFQWFKRTQGDVEIN